MNIGHLKNENFVNSYKSWGFATRNQLIDAAVELLKIVKEKERRAAWRERAHKEYAKAKEGNIWESLEGEDFEDTYTQTTSKIGFSAASKPSG